MGKKFEPNWTSPPGATIRDILEERGISIKEFARMIYTGTFNDFMPNAIEDLLNGKRKLTLEQCQRLEELFGAPAEFWMEREKQYTEDLQRLGMERGNQRN